MTIPLRVRYTPKALADIVEIVAWIRKDSESAGDRFESSVRQTAHDLSIFPNAGNRMEFGDATVRNCRWVCVKGFRNHLILYRLDVEGIEVVRVRHGSSDPDALGEL